MDWRKIEQTLIDYFVQRGAKIEQGDGETDVVCEDILDGSKIEDGATVNVSLSDLARLLAEPPRVEPPQQRPRQDMSLWQRRDMDEWLGDYNGGDTPPIYERCHVSEHKNDDQTEKRMEKAASLPKDMGGSLAESADD